MVSPSLAPTPPASSLGTDSAPITTTTRDPHDCQPPAPVPAANGSVARQMRLKVSYTFDDESKRNCLARWPHLVSTPVVQVDAELLVGAVELKTCILSIISASPELVATLSQDYSVYAYDFSEPGFPLVGCGMLSWAMLNTQNSSTRIMVTGRVSCNTFGIFSDDGIKETLEVKFRLQKVDTFTQDQFVKSVHAYTALSRMLPGDFDASAWSNFINAHPQLLEMLEKQFTVPATDIKNDVGAAPQKPVERPQQERQEQQERPSVPPASQGWQESRENVEESTSQPPKKRQRTTAKRAPRPKKKPGNVVASPAEFQGSESAPVMSEAEEQGNSQQQGEEQGRFLKPGINREVSEVSPSNMASSPPGQEEAGESQNGVSPAPTSPCLPSLPAREQMRTLETLYEEPEPTTEECCEPQGNPALVLPAVPQQGEQFLLPPPAAEPSPEASQATTQPKKRRSRTKKPATAAPTSDAVVPSSDAGYDSSAPKTQQKNKTRTAKHVKERIELQLMEAIRNGMMPNYCRNCGAIETAVWRRVRLPEDPSSSETPPKEEERASTEPDAQKQEDKNNEILLCNACGLWFLSHKTMRPQQLWGANKELKNSGAGRKRKKSASASALTLPAPAVQVAQPILLPDQEEGDIPRAPPPPVRRAAITPSAHRTLNTDWTNAIAESRRIAQSSPVLAGSAHRPIDLDAEIDGQKSPRRLLFPSARKPAPSPLASEKENRPPIPSSQETIRPDIPITPTRRPGLPPRTPLRSATRTSLISPAARRSASRPPPATPERRLLKSHQQRLSLSPTAGLLEKLLADDPNGFPDLNFEMSEEFLGTDLTMPSSPPVGFGMWGTEEEGEWSFMGSDAMEGGLELGMGGIWDGGNGLTVDLSAFIDDHTGTGAGTEGVGRITEEDEEGDDEEEEEGDREGTPTPVSNQVHVAA